MPKASKSKTTATKSAAKKAPVSKVVAKKATAKPVAKAPAAKPVAKKVAAVKAAPKKTVTKLPVAKTVAKPVVAKVAPKVVAEKPALQKAPVEVKAKPTKSEYKVGMHVVYPTHGVGKIIAEETQNIGEVELRVFVIAFDKDKMTLRVPVHRAAAAGLRQISNFDDLQKAFSTLKGRARTSRGMWSRRAQEYEAKINSGNLISIAEVVRDLHRNVDQSERSYSERMIYESAFGRLVGELAAAEGVDSKAATDKLMKVLKTQVAA